MSAQNDTTNSGAATADKMKNAGAGSTGGNDASTAYASTLPPRSVYPTPENYSREQNNERRLRVFQKAPNAGYATYTGMFLVDENKNITSNIGYSPEDIYPEFRRITSPTDRAQFFQTMYDYGFYGSSGRPSNQAMQGIALDNRDQAAINSFFDAASSMGYTWRAFQGVIKAYPKFNATYGNGPTVSVTAAEDIARLYKEESFRSLGRAPTKQETQDAIQYIQQQQRSRAGSGQDAPAVSTAVELQAQKAAPEEATAQKVGQVFQLMMRMLGGR